MRDCKGCAHCYLDDGDFICGHPDTGNPFGKFTRVAAAEDGHCGPKLLKFKQHPLRSPEGALLPKR